MKSRGTDAEDAQDKAVQYALKLLAGRDYTEAGMRKKLTARGFGEAEADRTIAGLAARGWLNDRRFAERFAESAVGAGRFFGRRLRQEMLRRGVPPLLADEILRGLRQEQNETDELRLLLERRFPGFSFSEANDRERRRVVGFLQRRGFGLSVIMSLFRGQEEYS